MKSAIFLVILLGSMPFIADAQSKRQKEYDAYWAEQAKLESFENKLDSAHKAFQEGNLELAIERYQRSLTVYPEDQFAKAKLQDLEVLLAEIDRDIIKLLMPPPTIDINLEERKRFLLEHTEEIPQYKANIDSISDDQNEEVVLEEEKTEVIRPEEVKPKMEKTPVEKAPTPEKTFDVVQFRKDLVASYKPGVTEEILEYPRKKIIRRIVVGESGADEYLKVIHAYGATFYFKNKQSASQNVWLKEAFPKQD